MHARDLVELAALMATHAELIILGPRAPVAPGALEKYWTTSKCRFDRWGRSLKNYRVAYHVSTAEEREQQTRFIVEVLEEILTGEVLTRVWSAVLAARDRAGHGDDAELIARSVLLGHLEARHRALTLLMEGPGISFQKALVLNRLRRSAERWTDVLVGRVVLVNPTVAEFAIEPDRAVQFARDLRDEQNGHSRRQAWAFMLASMRATFQTGWGSDSPNADMNAQIASAVMAAMDADMFDSTGLPHSLWMVRLARAQNDVEGLVSELLREEGLPPSIGARLGNRGMQP